MARQRKYDYGVDDVLMSDADLAELDRYKEAYDAAKLSGNQLGMTAAHEGAEKLRSKYGYSGGASGSEYLPVQQQDFSYENLPNIIQQNDQAIAMLQQQILGRAPFSYDYESDPVYQSYAKQYRREGQRAAADTMGQAAALTGGRPSSWAVTASQQAGNNYAAALADKIPELYQLAYQMYANEGDEMRSNLSTLMGVNGDLYNRWYQQGRDAVADARYDEQQAYQRERDAVADAQWRETFDYGKERDAVGDSQWRETFDYNAGQDAKQWAWNEENRDYTRAWNEDDRDYSRGRDAVSDARYDAQTAASQSQQSWDNKMELAKELAKYGDFSGFAALGLTPRQISALEAAWEVSHSDTGGGSGSGKGNGSGASVKDDPLYDEVMGVLMTRFPDRVIDDKDTVTMLKQYGLWEAAQAEGFRDGYDSGTTSRVTDEDIEDMKTGEIAWTGRLHEMPDSGTGTADSVNRILSYNGNRSVAVGAMRSRNVPQEYIDQVLDEDTFRERAQRRDTTLTIYKDYTEYLDEVTRDLIRRYERGD